MLQLHLAAVLSFLSWLLESMMRGNPLGVNLTQGKYDAWVITVLP